MDERDRALMSKHDQFHFEGYITRLQSTLASLDLSEVTRLADAIRQRWQNGQRIFLCGNGGSAGNAIHLENDLLYGIAKGKEKGAKVSDLSANSSVITCLANDIGYENVYAYQVNVKGEAGDLLIALSGSGNSENIVQAIKKAKQMKIETFALVGYDGGLCKGLADHVIYFPIDDMQICEDMQLIVGHMVVQALNKNTN